MTKKILVLCTGNSARSIMMEGLLNALGKGRVMAFSAGSQPVGHVNPLALQQLATAGIVAEGYRSKSWEDFARDDSEKMDAVITVCANAAGETCPVWPGAPLSAHWGFEDPAAVVGSDDDKRAAFTLVFNQIRSKVKQLLALPFETMNPQDFGQALQSIGAHPVAAEASKSLA